MIWDRGTDWPLPSTKIAWAEPAPSETAAAASDTPRRSDITTLLRAAEWRTRSPRPNTGATPRGVAESPRKQPGSKIRKSGQKTREKALQTTKGAGAAGENAPIVLQAFLERPNCRRM